MIARILRMFALFLLIFGVSAGLFTAGYAAMHAHVYPGLNAGAEFDLPVRHACAGITWGGGPGVFFYADCRSLS